MATIHIPLQRVLRLKSGDFITADEIEPEGQYPVYGGNGLRGFTNRFNTVGPIVLVGRQGAHCGNVHIAPAKCWVSEHALRCIPEKDYVVEFLRYALETLGLNRYSVSAAQPGLSIDNVKPLRVPFSPLEAQKRIAAFLDEKTAQIDGLIEKKQALMQRLREKRQAIITLAVTKGLKPTAPMRDSGIDWLGQIPAHWEVKRLSFVCRVIDCKHRTPEYIDDGIPLVSTSEISPYQIDYQTKRQVSAEELTLMSEGGRQPRVGDVIYSRNASVGSAALVRDDRTICLGQDLCLIRPFAILPEFAEYFLNSSACLQQLGSYLVGATFKRVNVDVVTKYTLPLPPREEQVVITSFLQSALANVEVVEKMVSNSVRALQNIASRSSPQPSQARSKDCADAQPY